MGLKEQYLKMSQGLLKNGQGSLNSGINLNRNTNSVPKYFAE
jgi:hypothetical protein